MYKPGRGVSTCRNDVVSGLSERDGVALAEFDPFIGICRRADEADAVIDADELESVKGVVAERKT